MLTEVRNGDKVCLLNKALYELRQAGRCWNDRLCNILGKFGTKKTAADPCIFTKGYGQNLLVAIYVNDLIVSESDSEICKRFLSNEFEIKSFEHVRYCLGIEFHKDKTGISMTQKKYI